MSKISTSCWWQTWTCCLIFRSLQVPSHCRLRPYWDAGALAVVLRLLLFCDRGAPSLEVLVKDSFVWRNQHATRPSISLHVFRWKERFATVVVHRRKPYVLETQHFATSWLAGAAETWCTMHLVAIALLGLDVDVAKSLETLVFYTGWHLGPDWNREIGSTKN